MFPDVTAPYGKRAIAVLIDFGLTLLIGSGLVIAGLVLLVVRGVGIVVLLLTPIVVLTFAIWNSVIRQGRIGQSIGKRQQGISIVKADTGSVPGIGTMILRELLFWFFNSLTGGLFLIVDYLFPVFDSKQQRIMDKMLRTRVINGTSTSLPPPPPYSPYPTTLTGAFDPSGKDG